MTPGTESRRRLPILHAARARVARWSKIGRRESDARFVDRLYEELLGRRPDEPARSELLDQLARGRERSDLAVGVARSDEFAQLVTRRFADHDGFVRRIYEELLGRPADPRGLESSVALLTRGGDRADVVLNIVASEEYRHRVVRSHVVLPDLTTMRPDCYRSVPKVGTASPPELVPVFAAATEADFDWVEGAILEFDYYERPGVWTLGIDQDKRLMAEMLASLGPVRALELGCASGAVVQCLEDLGVVAEGIDISRAAVRRADPRIAARIHCGDLLEADLGHYDLVYGLDIFEHLNPNRLDTYLRRIESLLSDGGLLFANIPAFGRDPVFGEIFEVFLDEWREADRAGRCFSYLQVDESGYPMHGHLVWATSEWWVQQFERLGLHREPGLERVLHERFDSAIDDVSVARKAFYVFSKNRTSR